MPLGGSGVANQVQTSVGSAIGVVANTYNGYGDDVAGPGVVDLYTSTPVTYSYLLCESGAYLVQEDGGKIILE